MQLTVTERRYIEAHQNVILAVNHVERYVTQTLRQQVDYLEAQIADEQRIEALREYAWRTL